MRNIRKWDDRGRASCIKMDNLKSTTAGYSQCFDKRKVSLKCDTKYN